MRVFAAIRLIIWALLLGICVTIVAVYFCLAQTFLQPKNIKAWADQSHLGTTIRDTIIAPKIIDNINATQPSARSLLTDAVIKKSLTQTLTNQDIDHRLQPALQSFSAWLDSAKETPTLTINTEGVSTAFIKHIADNVNANLHAAKKCTSNNSYNDVEVGSCFYDNETTATIVNTIKDNLASSIDSLNIGHDITFTLPVTTSSVSGLSLPELFNGLRSVAIVAGGILLLSSLWLLVKRRYSGLIAIGISILIGAAGTSIVIALMVARIGALIGENDFRAFIAAATRSLQAESHTISLILLISGFVVLLIGMALSSLMSKRRSEHMHFSRSQN